MEKNVYFMMTTQTLKNSCGDECYQLKIKNISDYRTENAEKK